jgi:hypothetical protein
VIVAARTHANAATRVGHVIAVCALDGSEFEAEDVIALAVDRDHEIEIMKE